MSFFWPQFEADPSPSPAVGARYAGLPELKLIAARSCSADEAVSCQVRA